ncbi:uncharacterized protein METZ01_LOCUS502326 [marine metagenome]|uniref:Uncharacterized protein n=1 Tax=marine metagenome TaxID=408172 RepID=A0A383DY56_9ZZZZ
MFFDLDQKPLIIILHTYRTQRI